MNITIEYKSQQKVDCILANAIYMKMHSDDYGLLCGYVDDELCYVLPFLHKRKYIFSYMQLPCETIVLNDSLVSHKQFLEAVITRLKIDNKIDFISQPSTNVLFDTYPSNAIYCIFGRYEIDLNLDEGVLFKNIHTKHKNVIKRAAKNGVYVEFNNGVFDDAYTVISDTLKRNNISVIKKQKLEEFISANNDNILIGCSYIKGVVQAGLIIIYDGHRAYYFWGGTTLNLSLGSNNFLHFEAIKLLKSKGVKCYDFVGARINTKNTKIQGIQRFKSRFGATLKQGYIWKYPIKKYKYVLFSILHRVKTRKGDIIDQEKNNIDL